MSMRTGLALLGGGRGRRGGGHGRRRRAPRPEPVHPEPTSARRRSTDTTVALDPEQAENAALIAAIAVRRDLPARAATIALATAYQESKLANLEYGDRRLARSLPAAAVPGLGHRGAGDGPGLRDQRLLRRPGRGRWATGRWTSRSPRRPCSAPAFPDAYADHEADARVLASALTRQLPARLQSAACDADALEARDGLRADRPGPPRRRRTTGDAGRLRRRPLGGFEPGGVGTGHMEGSTHYEGRAVDISVRPISPANKVRGWAICALPRRPGRPAGRPDGHLRRPRSGTARLQSDDGLA